MFAPEGHDSVTWIDPLVGARAFYNVTDKLSVMGQADIGVTERGQAITQAIDTAQVLTAAGPSGAVTGTAIPGPAPATPQNPATRTANPQTQTTTDPAENRTFAQTGTTASVAIGAGLAAIAGLVVVLRRR